MQPSDIPDIVIRRLPIYLRALTNMAKEGKAITSSFEMGSRLDLSPAQIRKDLSYFGEFGKQGMGYEVRFLLVQLKRILQLNHLWNVALVGAGDLGHALISHEGFKLWNFHIVALFDNDVGKIGNRVGDLIILNVEELEQTIRDKDIRFAIIAVPPEVAQTVTDRLVDAGVGAILNYAPVNLTVPAGVHVQSIDPVACLQSMAYYQQP